MSAPAPPPAPQFVAGLKRLVGACRSALISSHLPLDGDAVGSELGLQRVLRALHPGKRIEVLNEGPVPEVFRFLPGADEARVLAKDDRPDADLLITVDCGNLDRFGALLERLPRSVPIVNIDHHGSNPGYGSLHWIDAGAPAVGEMILRLARALGAPLDAGAALPLYVALVTDTGRFSYSNTDPRCHEAAAELLRTGIDPALVSRHVFRSKPFPLLRLEAEVALRVRFERGGTLAWSKVLLEDYAKHGLDEHEAQDLVDIPRSVRGVEVAALFREVEGGKAKVSLRSETDFDVARFAVAKGGGGHPRAAGFTAKGRVEDVERQVIAELARAVEGA
jgi:phosphoesterase RecJ-like protein